MIDPTDPTSKKDNQVYDPKSVKAWRMRFLDALRKHGVVTQAAKDAGIHRDTAYHERSIDPLFAEQWEEALERGVDALEDAAKLRAFQGSDTLLIFLLKSHRPERYKERSEIKHINITPDQAKNMTDQEIEAELRKRGLL